MKLILSTVAIAAAVTVASSASAILFDLNTLPTGPSGTQASYQPYQDYTALGLGTIPSAQGVLTQTVSGTTVSFRTDDYVVTDFSTAPTQTSIWTENESMNFGYLGVPASTQVDLFANTGSVNPPGPIYANFSNTIGTFSVDALTFTTNPGANVTLTAYSGLNGTGTVLGTTTGTIGAGTSYRFITLGLTGLNGAQSVTLLGSSVLPRYDNINVTLATPTAGAVPEPASWAMMLAGFGLVGAGMRRRTGRLVQAI